MRLILLGSPGAGRGTQSARLCQNFKIPGISTGKILREGMALGTDLGNKAKAYVEKGEWVPDEIMIKFMRQRLLEPDVSNGWVLEGYPRTAFQAEELDFLLDELEQKLNWAIYLQVSESVMLERCLKRSLAEDQPEIVKRRIENFQDCTIPILEYYGRRGRLLTINGEQSPDLVEKEILGQIIDISRL
ncbi:MAG: adenylate kinase family protein [Prochloraceae cyanobacterium]